MISGYEHPHKYLNSYVVFMPAPYTIKVWRLFDLALKLFVVAGGVITLHPATVGNKTLYKSYAIPVKVNEEFRQN